MSLFLYLSLPWVFRETKAVLFWLYLWQLKEYHTGRFIDYFRTEKGKQVLLNKVILLKIILVFALILINRSSLLVCQKYYLLFCLFVFLLVLYFIEAAKGALDFLKGRLKRPVLTLKTILLILSGILVEISFLFIVFQQVKEPFGFVVYLLGFDILTPLIVSSIVLLFQPLAVLMRNRIIRKAKKKREQFKNLLVIGITGSYGKTSTKEFLYTILSEKYKVLKTKEHQNSEVGISQCILNELNAGHEIFVCEMGAYNRCGIKLLCDIARPKIGVLTGINEQHMATFGSQENIIKGKYELIESLPQDGIAFFNGKNKYCLELYNKTKIKKFLYGENIELSGLENIEGAKMVARELGVRDEEIEKALQKIENKNLAFGENLDSRLRAQIKFPGIQLKKGINGSKIIDATFSANPDSIIAHLEYLKGQPGKKILVMPCLIELGKASKEVHRRIGKKIGEVCDLAIITTKDRFKDLQKGAKEAKPLSAKPLSANKMVFLENPREIFEKIKSFAKEGDTVLLESRVPSQLISLLVG